MNRSCCLSLVLSLPALFCSASCSPNAAAAQEAAHAHEPTSTTVFGERLLLFVEHPPLVRGRSARFLAHFTVLATGEPVRSGTVTLEIGSSRFTVSAPKRDGLFLPEGAVAEAGAMPARMIVESEQASEVLELGEVTVHASDEAADEAAHAAVEEPEPPDAVPFLLEPQWKVKLLLARAEARVLRERLIAPGRAVAPEGQLALVAPTIAGRLTPPPSGQFPRTGERVEAGQVLGFVEPPLGASEVAQLRALELQLDALDFEFDLKQLELLRSTSEARTRMQFAERERARIVKLRADGLSTQPALEQAEQALALAGAELEAAGRMRESLERLDAKRSAARGARTEGHPRFALEAPLAGTVIEARGIAGLGVAANEPVFRILDTSRLWVEGRVSEFDAERLEGAPEAVGVFAALPERRFELHGAWNGGPYIGPEVDASSRTLLVRYEFENSAGVVRPGMLAELQISTAEHEAPVAIPVEAVVMDQGLPTAYVMLEGELFQKRDLELGTKDGAWVEVLRGLEPGERVATRGAYLVKLAALSPASFGAGHAH